MIELVTTIGVVLALAVIFVVLVFAAVLGILEDRHPRDEARADAHARISWEVKAKRNLYNDAGPGRFL